MEQEAFKMTNEATLKIPAIHCESCVKTVTRTLEALPSVEVSQADLASKTVRLRFDDSVVKVDQIREALDEVGFSAED
jgi:Cu+-exporting ATPase